MDVHWWYFEIKETLEWSCHPLTGLDREHGVGKKKKKEEEIQPEENFDIGEWRKNVKIVTLFLFHVFVDTDLVYHYVTK